MAKRGNSVVGIDLGKRTYKAVQITRKSDTRYVLTNFASHEVPEEMSSSDDAAQHLRLLLKELGGNTRSCALAVSDPCALLRIIEQPNTPSELLRNALHFNGLSMLNQDCKDFVLDVAPISVVPSPGDNGSGEATTGQESGGVAVQAPP
ncbi:MAG: hypothetical protein ABI839_05940, partial [Verrucomicrobiota bacterium]